MPEGRLTRVQDRENMSINESDSENKRRSPGGIGITHRGDKYEATYSIPKEQLPPDSSRKRITAWGDSERSATTALIEKLQSSTLPTIPTKKQEEELRKILGNDGILQSGDDAESFDRHLGPTLSEWVEEWKINWMHDSLQESTRNVYFGHINTYILPFIGHRHLNRLSTKALKAEWWLPICNLRKRDADGQITDKPLLGNSALANVYKTLRMLLITAHHKHGTRVGLTEALIEMPKHARPESDREVKKAAAKLREIFIDNPDKDDPRWSLFALSLIGLRQGERLAIKVSDIDLSDKEDPVIYINNQLAFSTSEGGWYLKDATKNGEPRVVPLWGVFLEAVETQLAWRKKWARQRDWNPNPAFVDLLFLQPGGKLWSRRQDSPAWHEFVGEGIRGHLARHVTGHILAEEGIGVETAGLLLGHKSDAWAHYYRIASTREARRELRNIGARKSEDARVTSIKKKRPA